MDFSLIKGQDRVIKQLKNSLQNDKLSQSYLFYGPNGTGKLSTALLFAMAINCTSDITNKPCGVCNSCQKIMKFNHPDMLFIFPSTNLGMTKEGIIKSDKLREEYNSYIEHKIKQPWNNFYFSGNSEIRIDVIRRLIEKIQHSAFESEKKIFIVENVDKMGNNAANAFLKTLEEPPEDTIIIILTISRDLLLDTITSRCKIIEFNKVSKKEIVNKLKDKYGLSDEKAEITAGYSKGNLYKAFKIYEGEDKVLEYRDKVSEIVDEIFEKGKIGIYEHEKYFNDNKDNIDEILDVFMIWFRDVLFVKEDISDMIVNTDKLELLKKHSKCKNSIMVSQLQDVFQETYDDYNRNVNYNLIIENMLSKIQEV